MPASLIVLGVVVAAQVASASTVVVLSDPGDAPALGSALQVTLAGRRRRDRDVARSRRQPAARPRGRRAARCPLVQRRRRAVDRHHRCRLHRGLRGLRRRPLLPPRAAAGRQGDTPRMFAAIATSLLDELLSPDAPAVDVDVHVHVDPHGPQGPVVATIDPPGMPVRAGRAGPAAGVGAAARGARAHGPHAVKIGPMLKPGDDRRRGRPDDAARRCVANRRLRLESTGS